MADISDSKKILITCPLRGAGGTETHVLRLARLLTEHGADVTVACRIRTPDAPLDWFRKEPVLRFITTPFSSKWPRLAMAWALYFWPRLLPSSLDVLYTWDMSRLVCRLARLVKPSGYVIANRAGAAPSDGRIAAPETERLLDAFITETNTQLAAYQTEVPRRAIPLLVLPAKPSARKRTHGMDRLRVAYLGRYERPKGIFRMVDIWREAKPENAELSFYGIGPDRGELEAYIREQYLADETRVNDGWTTSEQQAAIFEKVDLVVLPSDSEGFPLVLLEALAHGVPFIASDVGGIRELAENNPDVAVVPLDNTVFARALCEMLSRIRSGAVSADRLKRYYAERYAPEKIAAQWRAALLEPEQFWG